jgi:membrane fusion protein, copper/silver efflux system
VKQTISVLVVLVLVGAAAGGGYWMGKNRAAPGTTTASAGATAKSERKILFYRNPMGLPDTSPVPKKDSMGMDYIAVYEGEEPAGPELKIGLDRVQKLGVKTETVARREFARMVRAVGTVQVNERLQHTVSPKFEGWIQRLMVATTGEAVRRGQPLMEVYSPDLVTAQQEYVIALKGREGVKDAGAEIQANMNTLAENSLQRLRNWDISDEELQRLQQEGRPRNTITLRSPVDGVVMAKPSVQGMRFMPGEALYRIADLSSLWLLAEVFEQDLAWIVPGQEAVVRVNAYPDKVFHGKVAFVYPTVTPETRTARVRIELPNPGRLLKPDMYASVELAIRQRTEKRLTVSDSAVLDSGARQIVLVQRDQGKFEPREVKLGLRGDGVVEVLEGLKEGETVVVSANFLIDSESNLKAAVGGFGQAFAAGDDRNAAAGAVKLHSAEGRVENVDVKTGAVSISHGPVASLGWPGMTMEFRVKDAAVLAAMKVGGRISFEFREQPPGDWTVIRAAPLASTNPSSSAPAPAKFWEREATGRVQGGNPHQGH